MDTLREMEVVRRSGTGLVALTLWACAAPMAAAQAPASCAALTGMAIPAAAIGLPTSGGTVTSAVVVPRQRDGRRTLPRQRRHRAGGPDGTAHPLPRRAAHGVERQGVDVRRRRLRRLDSQRRRQRAGRRRRPAAARDARLRGLRQRLRPPGRAARFAGRQLRPERRGAAQLGRRRAEEDARRGDLRHHRPLCGGAAPRLLRRRLHRRPRSAAEHPALAAGLGRRDRLVPGLEPGLGDAGRPGGDAGAGQAGRLPEREQAPGPVPGGAAEPATRSTA